jgi:hypothetical protein
MCCGPDHGDLDAPDDGDWFPVVARSRGLVGGDGDGDGGEMGVDMGGLSVVGSHMSADGKCMRMRMRMCVCVADDGVSRQLFGLSTMPSMRVTVSVSVSAQTHTTSTSVSPHLAQGQGQLQKQVGV